MTTHKCEHMGVAGVANHEYRWTGKQSGWCLFTNGCCQTKHSWSICCNWCGKDFPIIDLNPPEDPYRQHRCKNLIQLEWTINGQNGFHDDETGLANVMVEWDGLCWNIINRGTSIKKLPFKCPYCGSKLIDPKKFRNKVEIV